MADKFLQTLMDALAVGSLYALIALGYTMVYGILKFINFAHSDVFVLGAWVSYAAARCAGYTPSGEPQDIGTWVYVVSGAIAAAAAVLLLYERLLTRGTARTSLGPTFALVAVWSWAMIGMVFTARGAKGFGAPDPVVGGLILVLAMGTCGLVGFCLERLAYKPLRKAPRINVLITAIGVSLLLQNVGQLDWMFGTRPQSMPTLLPDRVLNRTVLGRGPLATNQDGSAVMLADHLTVEQGRAYTLEIEAGPDGPSARATIMAPPAHYEPGDVLPIVPAVSPAPAQTYRLIRSPRVPIRLVDVVGGGTAVVLMLLLDWLVFRTKVGRAMRAVSFNTANAALMGINVNAVISFTFVLGAALAAAAGFLFSQKYSGLNQTAASIWVLLGLKAFVAAVVGGIGNIRGAMLGGILIGLLEFFGMAYVSTELRDLYVFSLLIVVLLVKPSGLLGATVREKV